MFYKRNCPQLALGAFITERQKVEVLDQILLKISHLKCILQVRNVGFKPYLETMSYGNIYCEVSMFVICVSNIQNQVSAFSCSIGPDWGLIAPWCLYIVIVSSRSWKTLYRYK